jgi:hypothetical protein
LVSRSQPSSLHKILSDDPPVTGIRDQLLNSLKTKISLNCVKDSFRAVQAGHLLHYKNNSVNTVQNELRL